MPWGMPPSRATQRWSASFSLLALILKPPTRYAQQGASARAGLAELPRLSPLPRTQAAREPWVDPLASFDWQQWRLYP
jgi:hypothetical protein